MSIEQMRAVLMKQNYGPSWIRRVEGMSDKQVAAIYTRMLNNKTLK